MGFEFECELLDVFGRIVVICEIFGVFGGVGGLLKFGYNLKLG